MLKIFVAAGADLPTDKSHIEEAKKTGYLLAKNNYVYFQGARDGGMMGVTYKEFTKYSDDVYIISPKYFEQQVETMKFKYCFKVKSINERLETIIKQCDALIVLPGGNGTIDEVTNFVETKRSQEHNLPIVLINVNGFYDDYLKQMQKMIDFGYLRNNFFVDYLHVVDNSEDAITLIKKLKNLA